MQPGALTVNVYTLLPNGGLAVGFAIDVDDKLDPDHVNTEAVPPTGLAKRSTVPVVQIGPLCDGVAAATELTVTVVVYTVPGVQPDVPALLLTVNEYVLVTVGVAVGFCAVVDDNAGPLHKYISVLPPGFAVKVTDADKHIGPLLVGDAVGKPFTVTVVV